MTTLVTEREIRSPRNGRVPKLDSPAVSTRARARVRLTDRVGNPVLTIKAGARRWWLWTARPLSLRASWALSAIDPKRIPGCSDALFLLWRISNATDRLLMFGLVLIAPSVLQGPLRYIAARPTRRWGFYLVLASLLAADFITGRG
ncbi:hypothetical protein AB0B94_30815 [Micromonospora sp. NPDC048986]|uniref:hypothetical protein n=1 Tax=Micromonospora sp. NPDC048986 TaxID=3155644 RepID=UPI0033FD6FF7